MRYTQAVFVTVLAGAVLLGLAVPSLAQSIRPVVITTVSALPSCASALKGRPYYVTDGASATDCATGSGSTVVQCICDGSSYQGVSIAGGGGGGSAVVLDLADDGANESSDLSEIALTGDTNSIFTEPTADKLLIAVGNNWPTCDLANTGDSALNFFSAGTFENARISESSVTQHQAALTITEAQISDLQAYLVNVVEDTTPQLGGQLDAQGSGIVGLGDVTFQSGVSGGTLRTGTSAADLFKLQAYDTNAGTYRDMLELDAGVVPLMSLFHVTELDIDAGGAIRTGSLVGETALLQARDVDGAAWTTFATLTANNTPTFDLAASTTVGGAAIQTGTDDDVPESGDFGAATDLEASGELSIDVVAPAEMADADHGDVSWSGGVATVDSGAVGVTELADDATCAANEVVARNAGDTAFECQTAAAGGGDSVEVEDGDDAGTFSAVDTTAQLEDSGDINFVLTDGGVGGPDTVAGFVRSLDQDADANAEIAWDSGGGGRFFLNPTDDGSYEWDVRGAAILASNDWILYRGFAAIADFGYSGDNIRVRNEFHHGALVGETSSQTCADSGDANPGALTLTVFNFSYIAITNSDANGCTVTVGETNAEDGQRLEIVIVSNAGGTVDFADTAGVSETAGAFSAAVWDSITFRYASDRWVEISRSNN